MQTNEQVRAAALEDAAELVSNWLDIHKPGEQRKICRAIRALATSAAPASDKRTLDQQWRLDDLRKAAPERSGKLADEVYGYATEHDGQYIAFSKGVPAKMPAPYQSVPLYARPTKADSSSAAPSDPDILKVAARHIKNETLEDGREWRAGNREIIEFARALLAAPAPTGESLMPTEAGTLHDDGYFTWKGPTWPNDANKAGWRAKFYTEDQMRVALATPRQTEDGSGLSAAIMALRIGENSNCATDYKNGYSEGFVTARTAAARLASGSSAAAVPPSVQGGVSELTDTNIQSLAESDFYCAVGVETMDMRCRSFARAIERHLKAPGAAK